MTNTSRTRRWAVAAAAVVAVAAAGCGSVTAQGTQTSTKETPAPLVSISPLDELAGIGSGPTSRVALINAMETQVAACMSEAGWSYSAVERPPDASRPQDPDGAIAWSAAHGYGLLSPVMADPDGIMANANAANDTYKASLVDTARADYDKALAGCRKAAASLGAHFLYTNTAAAREIAEAKETAAADPSVAEATKAWSQCMADAGLPGDTLESGRAMFNAAVESGKPTDVDIRREREVAAIDARCSRVTVWPALAAAEQAQADVIIERFGAAAACGLACPDAS